MNKSTKIVKKPYYVTSSDCILYTESEKRDIQVRPRFII